MSCYIIPIKFRNKEWKINRTTKELDQLYKLLIDIDKKSFAKFREKGPSVYPEGASSNMPIPARIKLIKGSNKKEDLLPNFFQDMLLLKEVIERIEFLEFIEYSSYSELQNAKMKEGYVFKRTGGRYGNENRCLYICKYCRRYQKRWLILTENSVAYTTQSTEIRFHEVLMFKDISKIEFGEEVTGYPDGVYIKTEKRDFFFNAGSVRKREEWVDEIREAMKNPMWKPENNLYSSSFPPRTGNNAKWYVDGEYYFKDVYESLKKAKEQIFITDWWLSPEMYLLRPSVENPESQIVKVLEDCAERGVLIYIHMYKEITLACTFDSLHSKDVLKRNIKKNIQIIRHPQRGIMGGSIYWSHHEKIVCIDQSVAYIGGLDMCFGRWDTNQHRLADTLTPYTWNGIDYANSRIKDFINVRDYETTQINRECDPRMPWHDIGMRVKGPVANDVAVHFIDLWNHVITDVTGHYKRAGKKGLLDGRRSRSTNPVNIANPPIPESNLEDNSEEEEEEKLKEKVNKVMKVDDAAFSNEEDRLDYLNKKAVTINFPKIQHERLRRASSFQHYDPKKEIQKLQSLMTIGTKKNDEILAAEEEKINEKFKSMKGNNLNIFKSMFQNSKDNPLSKTSRLFQMSESEIKSRDAEDSMREQLDDQELIALEKKLRRNNVEVQLAYMLNPKTVYQRSTSIKYSCECEVVRSASLWSYGFENTEASIHQAYLTLIETSNYFIYIENQFFISSTAGKPVCNRIAQALVQRIIRAHKNKEKFRVVVMMPLLPGFEGNVYDPSATILKMQLHWEYQTICRGEDSIVSQLQKKGINYSDYIEFYGLRTHGYVGEVPATEIVYIHSKMMIVDDDIAIIGSANINDRSMVGYHDSEIAIVVKDSKKIKSRMNGEYYECGKFAATLRRHVCREFLGDDNADVEDPLSIEFITRWKNTAEINTQAYREIFMCYPDDKHTLLSDIVEEVKRCETIDNRAQILIEKYHQHLPNIKGTLVEFPFNFLAEERLSISKFSMEYLLPESSFI